MRRQQLLSALGGFALGLGSGAGLMYLFDPSRGRRRRDGLRDRARRGLAVGDREEPASNPSEGIGDRTRSLAAAVRARLHIHRSDGRTLEARVRARLGRVATNPSAIAVIAEGSRVTLRGSVPPDELDDVLDEVAAVQGVVEINNLLQVQLAAPYIPGHN